MSLWKIAWRSIQQRGLASLLTALSMGLGVALVVAVLVIHAVVDQSFRRGAQGYDMIVGAKGDRLQLVLSTVFHLGQPLANIPYSYYKEFVDGRFAKAVEVAVPICAGHDYRGCQVVATTPEMFDEFTYLDDRPYEFAAGKNFKAENYYEAVVGSTAARLTGLKMGDQFRPVATVGGEKPGEEGHSAFTVVGVLAPTGTPNDRAIFVNIEGFWRCPAHTQGSSFGQRVLQVNTDDPKSKPEAKETAKEESEHHDEHAGHHHGDEKQVTAILVATDMKNLEVAMSLPDVINKESAAQAVMPAKEITRLFDGIVGNIQLLLLILAVLVVVVAGIGMLVSIYNSMSDRRREIAIMRALGANRFTVMSVILLESIMLALGGGAMGEFLGHGLIGTLSSTIAEQTGVIVMPWQFRLVELILIPGLIVLATLSGYVPALVAYRTDVAKSLTANP
jgi:putative ABC transport system permease protein